MKSKLLFPLLMLITLSVFNCKKPSDKVTKTPVDSLISSTAHTKTGVENLLLTAYGLLDGTYNGQPGVSWETGSDNWLYGSVDGGDAYRGSNVSDQTDATAMDHYMPLPTNNWLDPKWQVNIQGIRYSNAVLSEIPLVKAESLSAADAAEIKAEAHFLHGFFELELAKMWHNVPFIDETVPYENGYKDVANGGPIWTKIEGDFTAAMNALPATQPAIGRATIVLQIDGTLGRTTGSHGGREAQSAGAVDARLK